MRIIIEIDGQEAAATVVNSQASRPPSLDAGAAPPEAILKAAALGATDAGPAPVDRAPPGLLQAPSSLMRPGVGVGAGKPGDLDAGAAPSAIPDAGRPERTIISAMPDAGRPERTIFVE